MSRYPRVCPPECGATYSKGYCANHYFAAWRRAKGIQPRAAAQEVKWTVPVSKELDAKVRERSPRGRRADFIRRAVEEALLKP